MLLEVQVDPSGKVSGTKIISGPVLLQAAAEEAIKRWKFDPATENGQAVAGKTIVSLKFLLP